MDQTRPFSRLSGLAEHETDARGAGIDDAVHALRAAMKTLGRASAHGSLIRAAVAIEPRHDHIGDLLDQCLVIAVIHRRTILTSAAILSLNRVNLSDALAMAFLADLAR